MGYNIINSIKNNNIRGNKNHRNNNSNNSNNYAML